MKLYEYTHWPKSDVELIEYEIHDEPIFAKGFADVGSDWTVIDVGAAIGYYTILAAQKASLGQVLAIEPHPTILKVLQKNIALHELKNVQIVHRAIASKDAAPTVQMIEGFGRGGAEIVQPRAPAGKRLIRAVCDGSVFSKLWRRALPGKQREAFSAASITLDALAEEHHLKRVDLVKMDVQGAEYDVLRGAPKVLASLRPRLLIEIHYRDGWTPEDLMTLLRSYNYRLTVEQIGQSMLLRADPVLAAQAVAR